MSGSADKTAKIWDATDGTELVTLKGPVSSVILRKIYYGNTAFKYIKKQRFDALARFQPIRLGWIHHRKLLGRYPSYAVGLFVLKFIQYLAAFLGLLIKFIR